MNNKWYRDADGVLIPHSLTPPQNYGIELTTEATARLTDLASDLDHGHLVRRALQVWSTGVQIKRGNRGLYNADGVNKIAPYRACCLTGAYLAEQPITVQAGKASLRPYEIGFDSTSDDDLARKLRAYEFERTSQDAAFARSAITFGHRVALAAGLGFNRYALPDGSTGGPFSSFTMIYRPWTPPSEPGKPFNGRIPYQVVGFMRPAHKFPGYGLPGGKVECGEGAGAAAIREAREEFGAAWDPADMFALGMWEHRDKLCSTWMVPAYAVNFLTEPKFEFKASSHVWLSPHDFAGPEGAFPDWGWDMVMWLREYLTDWGDLPWDPPAGYEGAGPGSKQYAEFEQ